MFDLRSFGLVDLLECSAQLQRLGEDASSMEEAAQGIVRYLYSSLIDKETDEPALALVRLYKTHRFDELEPDLQRVAEAASPGRGVAPEAPCLILLATAGAQPEWNDRRSSRDHRAFPLHDPSAIAVLPMVSQLTRELGFDEEQVVRPDPELFQVTDGNPGGVFYVAEASGSPHIPAQEHFVQPYGIRSVVGFGGLLPSGYVFAVVLFAKVPISRETAESFRALTFAAQMALLPFVERRLFESDPLDTRADLGRDLRMTRAQVGALRHLLEVRHRIVAEQAERLENARRDAEERADALERSRRRLEVSEASKAAILHAALDAIITMDVQGRIVDFNPAAERIFGYSRDEAVGQPLVDLIVPERFRSGHQQGLERYRRTGEGRILGQRIEIPAIRADGSEFPVELAVAAVDAAGARQFSGHVRDITGRVQAESELRAAGQRYAEIARILQSSLLPPELPQIPRVELAAVYRPGHEGLDVGGDFYDVFDIDDSRWGIVLGDVMGKGAEAAAATALARNTVRAAGLGTQEPTTVLRLLNGALHRYDPDRFCTAVFACLDVGVPDVTLALSSGGHPPPLLRSAHGVSTVELRGRLLGPFPDWDGTTATVTLAPGDLLLLFSDGVTEARGPGGFYGSEHLAAAVAAAAGASAAETLDAVLRDLSAFTDSIDDDIAIVALRVLPA